MPASLSISLFEQPVLQVAPENVAEVLEQYCLESRQTAIFCNVHMLMLAGEDRELAKAMARADYVFADGAPVSWLQRRITRKPAATITGFSFMRGVCQHAMDQGKAIGFFGASDETLEMLRNNVQSSFPGLRIAYCLAPPFSENEVLSSDHELAEINASGADYLFVGLGCPKQEKWVAKYASVLNCNLLAVGAAFDWLAGTSKKPPAWMEKVGLGWLHRLVQNPRIMWYRYLKYNSKFIFKVGKLFLAGPLSKGQFREPDK